MKVRRILGAAAVLAALAVAGCNGTTQHQTGKAMTAKYTAPELKVGADVIVGTTLYTKDGRRMGVPRDVDLAYALPAGGWLVEAADDSASSLWRIDSDGARHKLMSNVSEFQIDAAHRRIAWLTGGPGSARIGTGSLSADGITDRHTMTTSDRHPVALVGTDGVVLEGANGGNELWHASTGTYRKTDATPGGIVLGAAPDGRHVVVRLADNGAQKCFAIADPRHGFTTGHKTCTKATLTDDFGDVSTTGNGYLFVKRHDGSAEVYRIDGDAVRLVGHLAEFPRTVAPVTDSTAVGVTDTLVHFGLADPGKETAVPLPAGSPVVLVQP